LTNALSANGGRPLQHVASGSGPIERRTVGLNFITDAALSLYTCSADLLRRSTKFQAKPRTSNSCTTFAMRGPTIFVTNLVKSTLANC
jgi:hypothetical protein